MREHLMRWLRLDLSPADAAILEAMAQEQVDQQDQQHYADNAAWPISPTAGIAPLRPSPDADQQKHDDDDPEQGHGSTPLRMNADAASAFLSRYGLPLGLLSIAMTKNGAPSRSTTVMMTRKMLTIMPMINGTPETP